MTIDERLEKLVERHEALLKTLRLMARETREMKSGVDGLQSSRSGISVSAREIAEGTARLLHIAQIHEHRITRLEGQQ
jgi:hypothetical protein